MVVNNTFSGFYDISNVIYYFSGMALAQYNCDEGDSGGLVFHYNGGFDCFAVGIQSGKYTPGNSVFGIYSKSQNIHSELGVSLN